MRTQTIIESANVVVDDFNDFSEFSKEEEIISLLDENFKTSGAKQITKVKSDNVVTSVDTVLEQNVATLDYQNRH